MTGHLLKLFTVKSVLSNGRQCAHEIDLIIFPALSARALEYADCISCRGVRSPRKGATCLPWVATRDVRGRDPGG